MVQYILECIAFQLVFLIIYDFFLKRETFFQWNRAYLIGTYVLSMVLPWIKIGAFKTTVPEQYNVYPEFLLNIEMTGVTTTDDSFWSNISWESALFYGGMLLATAFFGFKLFQIYRLRKKGRVQYFPNFTRIIIENSQLAFSFFNSIFLGDKVLEKEHESIIQHELVHIEQKHSWDLLFFELMRIVGWFNPLVYVYQKRVSELHEFIADSKVAKTHKKEQYELLLSQVFQTENISFINQFFKSSLIKKRIYMLQKTKSRKVWQLKYLLLVPLVLGMLVYTSCEQESTKIDSINVEESDLSKKSNIKSVEKYDLFVSYVVSDIENLTAEEENLIFGSLKSLSKKSSTWALQIQDGSSNSVRFVRSEGDSYISGPNGEKINARLAVDSKLIKKDEDLIPQLLDKNWVNNSKIVRVTRKYNELVAERNRLLKSADEKNPIIVNLDKQLERLKKEINNSNGVDVPFAIIEEAPIFPGCEDESDLRECFQDRMRKHIVKHFKYPQEAQEKGIQGKVYINFVIGEEGNIIEISKRGPDKSLEDEAERIIKLLPKLTPGKHKGKAVRVPFSLPITFKLKGDSGDTTNSSFSANVKMMSVKGYSKNRNGKNYVDGTITDGNQGIPGVNIAIGNRMTVSNFDGEFSVEADMGEVITFQYKGLPSAKLSITNQKEYAVISKK